MRFLLVALSALSLCGVTPAFAETIPSAISAPASGLISVGPLVAPDVTMTAASPTVSAGCPAASYGGSGPAAVTSFLTYSKAAGGQWKAVPDAGIGGGYGWSLGLAPDTTASCSPRLLISGLVLGNVLSAQSPGSVRLTPGLSFGIRIASGVYATFGAGLDAVRFQDGVASGFLTPFTSLGNLHLFAGAKFPI